MFERIIILAAVAFSCGYGIYQKRAGYKQEYFDVALWAMLALLLSRIYYLVLILSNGNDLVFTIGVLGQASAYLFFLSANQKFLPELSPASSSNTSGSSGGPSRRICIPGALGALIAAGLFIAAAIMKGVLGGYIGSAIFVLCMCSSFYSAAWAIQHRDASPAHRGAYKFNICVCILVMANAVFEFVNAAALSIPSFYLLLQLLAVFVSAVLAIMLPLLKKEMDAWNR